MFEGWRTGGGRGSEAAARALVRLVALGVLVTSAVLAATLAPPRRLPDPALGNEVVWRLEVGLVVAVVLGLAGLVFVWSVVRGELPTRVGGDGIEYGRRVAADTTDAIANHHDQLARHARELRETREALAATTTDLLQLTLWAERAHPVIERVRREGGGTLGT